MISPELRKEIQELAERNIARDARHDDTPDELSREVARLAICMCKLVESLAACKPTEVVSPGGEVIGMVDMAAIVPKRL